MGIEGRVLMPTMAARFSYDHKKTKFMAAGMVRPNTFHTLDSLTVTRQTTIAYGGIVSAVQQFNKKNRLKISALEEQV